MKKLGIGRTHLLALGIALSCTACPAKEAPGPSAVSPSAVSPSAPSSEARFINDGSVVFAVIRANMVSGRTPSKLGPVPIRAPQYRIAMAASTSNLVEEEDLGDEAQTFYRYIFDTPDGAWNVLSSWTRNAAAGAADTIDLPDASIFDWIAGQFVATASLPPGVPETASAKEFRFTFKVSEQGYTGSYRYVETRDDDGDVLATETDFDRVKGPDGQPVVFRVINSDSDAQEPDTETGFLEDGDEYQETVTLDAVLQLMTKVGVFKDFQLGISVPYEITREVKTGLARATAKLPDGIVLEAAYTPTWNLSSGTLRDASGRSLGKVSLGADQLLEILLEDGRRLKESVK